MGKLYIIDGVDGCGKSTQIGLLCKKLAAKSANVLKIKFPNYASPSSAPVRMYLAGEMGKNVGDVNAYAASSLFAVDRYASYMTEWKEFYDGGGVIVSDRYVSSNLIHQGSKLKKDEALEFFKWLYDFEYEKIKLPKPDGVFFLDVSPEVANRQVESRYNGDETKKDLHEKDLTYLKACYETGLFACEHGFMTRIDCMDGKQILSPEEINKKITELILL